MTPEQAQEIFRIELENLVNYCSTKKRGSEAWKIGIYAKRALKKVYGEEVYANERTSRSTNILGLDGKSSRKRT